MHDMKIGDTYLVRLEPGQEVVAAIVRFANDRRIDAGSLLGLGTVHDLVLGPGEPLSRAERPGEAPASGGTPDGPPFVNLEGEHEIASLTGILAVKAGQPDARLQIVVVRRDGTTVGGRLREARAGATLELVIRPLPGFVQRVRDPRTGEWLLDV